MKEGQAHLTINKYRLIWMDAERGRGRKQDLPGAVGPQPPGDLRSLTPSDAAVKDLTTRFDISQPAVSQHLAMLTGAGLLIDRREGRCVYLPGGAGWNEAAHRLDRALPGFLDGARRSP